MTPRLATAPRDRAARRYAFFERLPNFVGLLRGPDHVYEYVNPAYERFVGRGDLVGHAVRDRFPDLEGQGFFEMLDGVYATGEPVALNSVPIRFADEDRFMDLRYDPTFDEHGAIDGIFVSGHDLTDRVRAETRRQVLAELSERLRDLSTPTEVAFVASELLGQAMRANRAGFGTIDQSGEVLRLDHGWTSPEACALPEVVNLRAFGSFVDDLKRGAVVAIGDIYRDPRTGAAAAAYERLGTRAFAHVPVIEQERLVALLYVTQGKVKVWTAEDVAFLREFAQRTRVAVERSRSDLALRELTASLEQQVEHRTRERDRLWETSEDLLAIADYGGRLLRISPSWMRCLGYGEETLLSGSFMRFIHPDDVETVLDRVMEVLDTGQPARYECRLVAQDGNWRWIAWSLVPEPAVRRVNAVGRDITADRQAEQVREALEGQLRQAQKMEAVGQLTGGIAHDFNNMVLGITGSLQLAGRRLASGRTGEVGTFLERARAAAERAAALTRRLLAFSRQQPLHSCAVDANALIDALGDLFRGTLGERIGLEFVPAPDLWPVLCDPNQLESALLNLILNARDAMPEGGTVTIETHNAECPAGDGDAGEGRHGDFVRIDVRDTGTGMSEETIASAFDPFFTTKPPGRGTGLGLSMVHGFARQSDGFARIGSGKGEGTTVSLWLPRHAGEVQPEPAPTLAQHAKAGHGKTVLVVEDDAIVRTLVVDVLAEHGFRTLQAPDGEAGLALLRGNLRIDLLVIDLGLPDMGGDEIAEAARRDRPDLPVLFMTAHAEKAGPGVLRPGMELIAKPFGIDELVARAAGLVAG